MNLPPVLVWIRVSVLGLCFVLCCTLSACSGDNEYFSDTDILAGKCLRLIVFLTCENLRRKISEFL